MLSKFKNFIKLFDLLKFFFKSTNNYIYKIEQIDESSGRITISCRGKGATLITKIEDLVHDDYILRFMPPHHACWVGYYYGKFWCKHKFDNKKSKKIIDLVFNEKNSIYKIICQHRSGKITYIRVSNGETFTKKPTELAKSKLISKFNSMQAYYIGFLSAFENIKKINSSNKNKNSYPSYIKIIK